MKNRLLNIFVMIKFIKIITIYIFYQNKCGVSIKKNVNAHSKIRLRFKIETPDFWISRNMHL